MSNIDQTYAQIAEFARKHGVRRIILFGSRARGDELVDALSQAVDEYMRDLERDVPWLSTDALPVSAPQVTPQVTPQVRRSLSALGNEELSAAELRERLGLSDAKSFRQLYLRRAIDADLVEMTIPNKPRSRNQRYRLTELGARTNATTRLRETTDGKEKEAFGCAEAKDDGAGVRCKPH